MLPRRFAALIAILLATASAAAQESVTAEMQPEVTIVKQRAEEFFTQLAGPTPDAERAVRAIIANGPLQDPARTEDIKKLIDQAQTLDQRVGAYKGHEWVSSRTVGSHLIFVRYLYKGDRFPLVWYFTFYRATANGPAGTIREWTLISLRFDNKVEVLDR
jgi:hypothetical protein